MESEREKERCVTVRKMPERDDKDEQNTSIDDSGNLALIPS